MQSTFTHEHWSSRTAFLLAAIGAAVGLGNIWRFPYVLGTNGGAAFVLVYLLAIFLIAMPVMIGEMILGRHGRMSAPATLQKVAVELRASPHWKWLGWLGIVVLFLVLSFFSVIGGWSMAYVFKTASGQFTGMSPAEVGNSFELFLASPGTLIFWHAAFMALTIFIVSRGVKAGIEKAVTFMMPALFVMLIGLVIYGMFAGDFAQAVSFLFQPDFSKLTPEVTLDAVGQAFFSVNVGIGALLTYAAYMPEDVDLLKSSVVITVGDTIVALLAGLMIFPIVFAYGLDPAEGPGLIFVTLSTAFGNMPGGAWIGSVFFVLVFMAALTSALSMLEVAICRLEENAGASRAKMSVALGSVIFLFGLLTVLSFNVIADLRPLAAIKMFSERNVFELIAYLATNVLMPLGGLLYAVFVGWWLSKEMTMQALGLEDGFIYRSWRLLIRYVAPIMITLIFVTLLLS